jgi:hypothetical protein
MKTSTILVSAIALLTFPTSSAHAIPRTFVSGTGGGVACTRAAPCADFQTAHNATDPNGEINCIDAGSYGPVTISKNITIDCTGTVGAITSGGAHGVTVDALGVRVRLRNLTISNLGVGFFGVNFENGAALFVENCRFQNNIAAIRFAAAPGTARLFVSDSTINASASGSAIAISSTTSTAARATLDGVRVDGNASNGIRATALAAGAVTVVHIRNSEVSGALLDALSLDVAANAVVSVTADRTSLRLSGSDGASVSGSGSFLFIGRSTVMSNQTGLAPSLGGHIVSYQNNHLTGNATDGAPTSVLTLK